MYSHGVEILEYIETKSIFHLTMVTRKVRFVYDKIQESKVTFDPVDIATWPRCIIRIICVYSVFGITVSARIPQAWIFRAHRIRWPLPAARAHLAVSLQILTATRLLPVSAQTRRLHQPADRHFNIRALHHHLPIRHISAVLYEAALHHTGN